MILQKIPGYWLSVIGTISIMIATFIFSYRIPKIDSEIAVVTNKIRISEFNIYQMHIAQAIGILTHNQWKILGEIYPNSDKKSELLSTAIEHKKIFRLGAKILAEGNLPGQQTQLTNDGSTLSQLNTEIAKYLAAPEYHNSNLKQKSVLERQKNQVLFWSIIFQIGGLFCLLCDEKRKKSKQKC